MNKVLICSDNEETREKIKELLGNYREMIISDTTEQSFIVLKRADIDIIITDQNKVDTFQANTKEYPNLKCLPIKFPFNSDEILSMCK